MYQSKDGSSTNNLEICADWHQPEDFEHPLAEWRLPDLISNLDMMKTETFEMQ